MQSERIPDCWVKLKLEGVEDKPLYKILAGWVGGYLDGDRWRMNSGIEKTTVEDDYYLFHGYSGSVYKCHKDREGLRMVTANVLNQLKDRHKENISIVDMESDSD